MEEFIERFSAEAEQALRQFGAGRDLGAAFGRRLLASLPLGAYAGPSCCQCGRCDLAQQRTAEHLEEPAEC